MSDGRITHLRDIPTMQDPSSHSYSHGVRADRLLAIAGQCGVEHDGSVPPSFAAQSQRVLERLEHVVRAAGGTKDHIISMTVFVTDIRLGPEFTAIRREFFGRDFPASALIGVHALMPPGALVEAQAWAVLPDVNAGSPEVKAVLPDTKAV